MVTQNYSAQQRRALNLIWTAAGEYGFDPLFMAFGTDKQPDFYMNCIIGLVRKWYGDDMPQRLFASWTGDRRQAALDDLSWLGIENAVYERELPHRPVLQELRRQHAEHFFSQEYQLSRQEWMSKNQLVYTLQTARWREVLGKRGPVMAPWEKGLHKALHCAGTLDAEGLETEIRAIMKKYLQFDGVVHEKKPLRLHFDERWAKYLTKLMPTELVRTDELTIGRSTDGSDGMLVQAATGARMQIRSKERKETDGQYIERCFGRSLFSPRQLAMIEQERCTGNHFGCHLWFTDGAAVPGKPQSRESLRLAEQAVQQAERNRKAYSESIDLHQNAMLRLTAQIRNCMLVHQQPQAELARRGRLDGSRVWREAVLEDSRVFTYPEEEPRPGFSVDLLLDASASRLHCQEIIAAQGYILSESLSRCGIPVQVSSFCSLRGYTVLRRLKAYQDKQGGRKIFDYFAAGWNRDGLALRGMEELMKGAPGEKHLLILLTDASPNDSHKIPPNGKIPLSREYGGGIGVQDAADEVRALRRKGIRVGAVFMGENMSIPAAELIFGRDLARIRRMDQLAAAAGRLIQTEIQELSV